MCNQTTNINCCNRHSQNRQQKCVSLDLNINFKLPKSTYEQIGEYLECIRVGKMFGEYVQRKSRTKVDDVSSFVLRQTAMRIALKNWGKPSVKVNIGKHFLHHVKNGEL